MNLPIAYIKLMCYLCGVLIKQLKMIALIKQLAERDSNKMVEYAEKFSKYHHILINCPKYTDDDCELWFEFMKVCLDDWLFALYSVQVVVDSLLLNAPQRRYIRYNPIKRYNDSDEHYIAFAYVNHYEWQLEEIGLDTWSWSAVVRDNKNGTIYKFPIDRYSSNNLCIILAELRSMNADNIKTADCI